MAQWDDDKIKVVPKHKVGDKLFYIKDGYVYDNRVTACYNDGFGRISYTFDMMGDPLSHLHLAKWYQEWMVYSTKAALIKSL